MLYPITLDGFAAAYAAWLRLGPDATYFGYYEPADVDLRVVDGATVRAVTLDDLPELYKLEASSYPADEAATEESLPLAAH